MNKMPTGAAMVAGVTGWPVAHSLSPRLHGHWLRRYGIDGAYLPFPVEAANFECAVRGLAAAGVRGLNVTVPHKRAAFEIADTLDEAARAIGAVNTLSFGPDGQIAGSNTDAPGFLNNLLDHHVDPAAGPVVMLGAGGAARAAAFALLQAGAPEVRLINRSRARAEEMIGDLADARLSYHGEAPKTGALRDAALLVNTTSMGMEGQPGLTLNQLDLPPEAVVHDIVYVPLRTGLLAGAEARGMTTVDGLGMLLHQAAPAFETFFGRAPEVDQQLRDFVLEAL